MTLTFDSMTVKTLSLMATQMMNICAKFHWNLQTKYRDITWCGLRVNGLQTYT